jgi:hypothetical protein
LVHAGMQTVGVDIVPDLIQQALASSGEAVAQGGEAVAQGGEAIAKGGAEFQVQDYAAIAKREWRCLPCGAAVCNFSLLGNESVESLIAALPYYLDADKLLVIQTLHPLTACGAQPYQDGWREGSWCGFSSEFSNPAPWYFRTVESWHALLERSGFAVKQCIEPRIAAAAPPASIIWVCSAL